MRNLSTKISEKFLHECDEVPRRSTSNADFNILSAARNVRNSMQTIWIPIVLNIKNQLKRDVREPR